MSAVVKLSTKMPGDPETNGVDSLAARLVKEGLGEETEQIRVAVVWFDVQKVTTNSDSGEHVPTIRVRRIEPVGAVGDVDAGIAAAVEAAVEKRTGRKAIPFGIVEVDEGGSYGDPQQLSIADVEGVVDSAIAEAARG